MKWYRSILSTDALRVNLRPDHILTSDIPCSSVDIRSVVISNPTPHLAYTGFAQTSDFGPLLFQHSTQIYHLRINTNY